MSKKYIIIIAGIILVLMCIFAFLFLRTSTPAPEDENAQETTPGELPAPASSTLNQPPSAEMAAGFPKGETLTIGTPSGSVTVKNFYPRIVGGEENTVVILEKPTHFISYDTMDSSFWVAVAAKPFLENRAMAERDFLEVLGISQGNACRLNVVVGIPYGIDPSLNGRQFNLSFCGGGL